MVLSIDTSSAETIKVGFGQEVYESPSRQKASQKLLPFIEKLLKKQGLTLKEIDEIRVSTGPGSFTGLRVGVSVANALGWALGIPVNGKKVSKTGSLEIKYN